MPGIDPALLSSLGSNQAYPGSAPSPVTNAPDNAPTAEPVALHEACTAANEALTGAQSALEDLSAQAELAEDIDAKSEKSIGKAALLVQQAVDLMADVEKSLGEARSAHDDAMDSGDTPADDGPA